MDVHSRRRKMSIGISFIEDVFADVLREAKEKGDGWLTTSEIRDSVNPAGHDDRPAWTFCQDSLYLMKTNGEVESKETHPRRWRLVD